MVPLAVRAAGRRGRATARNSLSVATSRAGGVGAAVHGAGVVERADGADRGGGGAPRSNVAVTPAVFALGVPIGGVGALNSARGVGGVILFFYFLYFLSFYIIYSLLRYKKSRRALAMAKTKPKSQNELTKEKSITKLFNWGPYRSPVHTRARH